MDEHRSAADSHAARYSVVVPFFNEQDSVIEVFEEIRAALHGYDFEIIAVDDGSSDATLARLQACALRAERMQVVRHEANRGQSAALCSGADAAGGRYLLTLDGDGQNDPRDFLRLIGASLEASPAPLLVCGYRRTRRDHWLRRLSSQIANAVRARLLADATPDTGCGLKLIERAAFMRLPRFDHMHRFLPALIQRDGGKVVSVEVSHRPRRQGRSKYGLWNRLGVGIVDLAGVIWLTRRPLRRLPAEEPR